MKKTISAVFMFVFLSAAPALGTWVEGTPEIWQKAVELGAVPGEPVALNNHKSSTPFETELFYTWNFKNDGFDRISATCWVEGVHCYIFISERVDPQTLLPSPEQWCQDYADAFDLSIYPTVTAWLGPERRPPDPLDVDGDDKIVILLDDVQDNYPADTDFYEGYFCFADQYDNDPQGTTFQACSNERDMFVVDASELYSEGKNYGMKNTMAHMFAHLCMFDNDREEKYWIEEGLCCLAEYLPENQYPVGGKTNTFRAHPDNCLLRWENSPGDYGSAFFFMEYLKHQFAETHPGFFRTLVEAVIPDSSTPYHGIAGLQYVLQHENCSVNDFKQLFENWTAALYANDTVPGPEYYVGPVEEIDTFTASDINSYFGVISSKTFTARNYGITPFYFQHDRVKDFVFNVNVENGLDPACLVVGGHYTATMVDKMIFDQDNKSSFSLDDETENPDFQWAYILVCLDDDSVSEIEGDRQNLYDDTQLLRSFTISATAPNFGALCTCAGSSATMGLLPGLLGLGVLLRRKMISRG